MSLIEINLSLATPDEASAIRAWDTISRLAAGFAFDGIHAETSIDRLTYNDDDDDEDDQAALETADTDDD